MSDVVRIQHLRSDDGVSLALHRVGPADGIPVILAPGTFSNWSFWLGTRSTGFARLLASHGFEACVLDFRGHGASQRQAPGQRWTFDDWGRHDVPAAVRTLLDESRRPLLVGHSAGGASILAALAAEPDVRDGVTAAIVAATPLPWLQHWRKTAAWAMRFASRHMNAFPARLLGLGPEDELPGVMEQWMDWNIQGRWTGDDGTDYAVAFQSLMTPLLFLAGSGDHRFAPPHAVRGLHDLVGSPDRLLLLAGTDTGFSRDYNHVDLIVSRDARREIWPVMLDWLRVRVG
ncbi:MAG TPA: alpha/beta fold hydrolase [Longimicrobiales bacterium]|nr:alpha/beta fold hydrolase [Longimicrobiales bacterium]